MSKWKSSRRGEGEGVPDPWTLRFSEPPLGRFPTRSSSSDSSAPPVVTCMVPFAFFVSEGGSNAPPRPRPFPPAAALRESCRVEKKATSCRHLAHENAHVMLTDDLLTATIRKCGREDDCQAKRLEVQYSSPTIFQSAPCLLAVVGFVGARGGISIPGKE
jgi:hypothetical protein